MKKFLTIFGAVVLLFGFTAGAQAAMVTVTFDEIEAWNAGPASGGKWITEEYASLGVHFVPGDFGQDGVLYDVGVGFSPDGVDGTQFIGVGPAHPDGSLGSSGLVMTFDLDQTYVSFDMVVGAPGTFGGYWLFLDGAEVAGVFQPMMSGTMEFTGVTFDKILFATSLSAQAPNPAAIDNLTFDAVPIPASVLLLGTGLLPLLRLRRRS